MGRKEEGRSEGSKGRFIPVSHPGWGGRGSGSHSFVVTFRNTKAATMLLYTDADGHGRGGRADVQIQDALSPSHLSFFLFLSRPECISEMMMMMIKGASHVGGGGGGSTYITHSPRMLQGKKPVLPSCSVNSDHKLRPQVKNSK